MDTIRSKAICAQVVAAYSHCPRKAFLLHCTEERGAPHEYLSVLEECANVSRTRFLTVLQKTSTRITSYGEGAISSGIDVLTETNLKAGDVEAYCDVLTKIGSTRRGGYNSAAYEPTIVLGTPGVQREQVLRLSFAGYVLGQVQGTTPTVGYLVTAGGERRRINLQPEYKAVKSIVSRIRDWSTESSAQPPPVILNKHCPYCPFKVACTGLAEAADDLSLLDRMTPKSMRRYHSKGIFTVTQLSFLFKPRRRRRRDLQRILHFNLEIQALAIRTGKIYIQALPEIQKSDVALFLDIEGVPDRKFSYLIGLLVHDHGTATQYSFWADAAEDEESIWRRFVQKIGEYPDAPIYHYGSYEARVIESFVKRFGPQSASIAKRLVNLNSQVYGRVYFPVRSNSLKVLGKFLGAAWAEPDASGLQSLVWRYWWETGGEAEYKEKLISYNTEDCQALRILTEELARLRTEADSQLNVDYVDQPKWNATNLGSELHAALDHVLLYASVNNRGRSWFQESMDAPKRKGPGALKGHLAYERTTPVGRRTVTRVVSKRTCPKHKGEHLQRSDKEADKIIVDLTFANTGCRKRVIKYLGEKRYCPRCERYYEPPAIERIRSQTFGHGFRAWAVYQRIILRLHYRIITQAMEELFHETASAASIINFIESFADDYRRTESILVKRLRESPFVHVDETRLNIRGVDHYVWVFTDGRHVVFRLTEKRETTIVQELLSGYQGVLVSDFYPGYDGLPWRQQKCWVHLIRDINDDLWKFPFDEELQKFVLPVKDLIVPILEAIDRWGLRTNHLGRFKKQVDRFYSTVIDGKEYALEITKKYQKRFARYRESLFRFLEEDGIPWNNNTAERAIRHLAVQRKISGALYSRGAVDYLELLGIAQTCRFQEKSFLKFLLSGEIDVDGFQSGKRLTISRQIHREPQTSKRNGSVPES
jgi:predicted RecB family nuclease